MKYIFCELLKFNLDLRPMNNSKIRATFLFLFVANFFFANAQNNFSFQDLNWLAGSWIDEDSVFIEEWHLTTDGILEGSVVPYKGSEPEVLEDLQIIERNDNIIYRVFLIDNINWTEFILTSTKNETWIFENPEHDFPKIIEYKKLNNNEIRIRVEGSERSLEFTYFRLQPEGYNK